MRVGVMSQSGQVATEFKKVDFKQMESDGITEIKCIGKSYKEEEIAKAVDKLNKLLQEDNTTVEYSIHEVFGDTMIKIINKNTKEVLVEVPPKSVLDLVAKMCERAGMIIDKKS